jgi:hypothetical protein
MHTMTRLRRILLASCVLVVNLGQLVLLQLSARAQSKAMEGTPGKVPQSLRLLMSVAAQHV